ncbi:MAG: sulfotransferase domain-containing protein [Anaerolineales bacterium]|nr:sulfotransferase domain-containing protein [Anaerolineales bacterium]MCB8951268.1 sulfotransferase domain-containing protein [Ardenticatenales bacterium]
MPALERLAQRYLPPPLARGAKQVAVYPRYWWQARKCRHSYQQFHHHYPQPILFVAGLPKSGTTWLERMLASYPGFHPLLIPEAAAYELRHGGSDDYDLPPNFFHRFRQMLVLTKMHVHGSPHNARLLQNAGLKYVVLYRDLRDVAVSYTFYVRQTPWHPDYPHYRALTVAEGLARFARERLPAYANWVRSWQANGDPQLCLFIRYEDMLVDTPGVMRQVADHFGLDAGNATISAIVNQHQFARLRQRAETTAQTGFYRKGISGDWQNCFTPDLVANFKSQIGEFLITLGYEPDLSW